MNKLRFPNLYPVGSELDDLNLLQEYAENEIKSLAIETKVVGIQTTVNITENTVPDLTVLFSAASGGFIARDVFGQPIQRTLPFTIDVSQDYLSNPTEVVTLDERYVTIFVKYNTVESYPMSGFGGLNHKISDSYTFEVRAGSEATTGNAVKPSKPSTDYLVCCDVLLTNGMTEVTNTDIDTTRTDWVTQNDASDIAFQNTGGYYDPAVNDAEAALEEAGQRITDSETDIATLTNDQKRDFIVSTENFRMAYNKSADAVYLSKREKYSPAEPAIATNGASVYGLAFIHEKSDGTGELIFKVRTVGAPDTYSAEVLIDSGLIDAPIVAYDGTNFVVFYLWRSSSVSSVAIKYQRVDTSGALSGSKVDDAGDIGSNPVKDLGRIYYNAVYDSVNQKYITTWQTAGDEIYYVDLLKSDDTKGTVTRVDYGATSGYSHSYPKVVTGATHYGFTYIRNSDNALCFRASDFSYSLSTEIYTSETSLSGLYTRLTFISTNFFFVTIDSSDDIAAFKVDEGTLASIDNSLGTFDDGGAIEIISGIVVNSGLAKIAIFYKSDSSAVYKYREVTTSSLAGTDTTITGLTGMSYVSNTFYKSGASNNYGIIGVNSEFNTNSKIKELTFFQVTEAAGSQSYDEFVQGNGGWFSTFINSNPNKLIKAKIADYDGQEFTLNDREVLFVTIPDAYFTEPGEGLIYIIPEIDSITDFRASIAYNKVILLYRWDDDDRSDSVVLATGESCLDGDEYPKSTSLDLVVNTLTATDVTTTDLVISSSNPISSISTGSGDNDKLPTQGYVDDLIAASSVDSYADVSYAVTSGTGGGDSVTATWNIRPLNTISTNIAGCSLATNQITLPAGTYDVEAMGVAFKANGHKLVLRNTSDSTNDIIGFSCQAASGDNSATTAHLKGRITIASSKIFELWHRTAQGFATYGLGTPASALVDEVYAQVFIKKVG